MWLVFALGAALTQSGQFAVAKAQARQVRPLPLAR
jgi:hypothetical protein